MLLEAIPAIYRPALGRLERYLAVLPAVRALRVVHLSGATEAPAPVSVSVSHILTLYFFYDIALENRVRFGRSLSGTAIPEQSSSVVCLSVYYIPTI